jgi:preprotein translocase subunit SecE
MAREKVWKQKDLTTNELYERSEMSEIESREIESSEERGNIFQRAGRFYRQVVAELRKVVWPSRKQLTTYTAVVLVFVSFIIAVVSLFDLVLTKVTFWVFG